MARRKTRHQLRVDAHSVLITLHRAFEHVADAEFLADLFGVDAFALEGEGGIARDDETVLDAGEFCGEVLGDSVGKIILGWIAGEIGEGQHDNRKMRVLRGFRHTAAKHGPTAAARMKRAAMAASASQREDQPLVLDAGVVLSCSTAVVAAGASFLSEGWTTSSA